MLLFLDSFFTLTAAEPAAFAAPAAALAACFAAFIESCLVTFLEITVVVVFVSLVLGLVLESMELILISLVQL